MRIEIIEDLAEISPNDWNRLCGESNPFISYEFLIALERNACLHQYGWYPQHCVAYDEDRLIAAMPMYLKDNSYGELVFDWAWADAYHRTGLRYYPKLVTAIPYTPISGSRILIAAEMDYSVCATAIINYAMEYAGSIHASGLHWLFTDERDTEFFRSQGYALRLGCQFHWHNQDYTDFDHFLAALTSQKRKMIKRERRHVKEQGIELEIRNGQQMNDELWSIYHGFYRDTFARKSGYATLSLDFFHEIGQSMPDKLAIVMAKAQDHYVASAFSLCDRQALYGRHWGCNADYHGLHFEACYYQGIEYCIKNKLQTFIPGAQGEHKISRGFLPQATWSAHWLANSDFNQAILEFAQREQLGMHHYMDSLNAHTPYKIV